MQADTAVLRADESPAGIGKAAAGSSLHGAEAAVLRPCSRRRDQSNWQPKTSYNVAKPTGQAQSFSSWNAKSATVGGVMVQGVQRGMGAQQPKVIVSQAHEVEKPSIYAPGDHVLQQKIWARRGCARQRKRIGCANYDSL